MNETVNENVLIKNKLNQWFTNDEIFKIANIRQTVSSSILNGKEIIRSKISNS